MKNSFWFILYQSPIHLSAMQKISKYFPYFSIIAQNIPQKYLKTPKIIKKTTYF